MNEPSTTIILLRLALSILSLLIVGGVVILGLCGLVWVVRKIFGKDPYLLRYEDRKSPEWEVARFGVLLRKPELRDLIRKFERIRMDGLPRRLYDARGEVVGKKKPTAKN